MKRLCVFCGSNPGRAPTFTETARRFGEAMVARRLGLVYGGGRVGMMGTIADAVLAGGGEVIGVIPDALVRKEVAHQGVTELRVVGTMHERKALMADLADGFVALPGGLGTLDEMFEIWTWAQLGIHRCPVGFLNVGGFFDRLFAFLDQVTEDGFLSDAHRNLVVLASEPDEMLDALARARPVEAGKWMTGRNR